MTMRNYSNFKSNATPVAFNAEKSDVWIGIGVGVTHTIMLNDSG